MSPAEQPTAAQRALVIPELVQRIIVFLHFDECCWEYKDLPDDFGYGKDDDSILAYTFDDSYFLLPYLSVNKIWYAEAMPYVWASISRGWSSRDDGLEHIFAKIEPERRQFHANLIARVNMHSITDDEITQANEVLGALCFPKLKDLTVWAGMESTSNIPRLGENEVTSLTINPRYEINPEHYGVHADDWEKMFESAPASFPKLKEVHIIDRALIWQRTLDSFKANTNLNVFDHGSVDIAWDG